MSGHTPGPWTHRGQHAEGPLGVTVAFCVESMLAGVDGSYSISRAESEANARLIAAAPDLLAAARLIFKALENATLYASRSQVTALAAAIAKAEGR